MRRQLRPPREKCLLCEFNVHVRLPLGFKRRMGRIGGARFDLGQGGRKRIARPWAGDPTLVRRTLSLPNPKIFRRARCPHQIASPRDGLAMRVTAIAPQSPAGSTLLAMFERRPTALIPRSRNR